MNDDASFPVENPFCTRRIRPGSLPYLFSPDSSWEAILSRLRNAGSHGEIIGPHGSGKSTLLAGLIPLLEAEDWHTHRIDLHDGERRLPVDLRKIPTNEKRFVLIVDGYEQLSRLSRFQVKWHCRRHGWGLIVTAHSPTGLPELFSTEASLEQANRVVGELLKNSEYTISPKAISECYVRCQGNLREMLFELYDRFEQQRKS
jgi:energy-coupling factor transporter ATP-binding protein EcfA2